MSCNHPSHYGGGTAGGTAGGGAGGYNSYQYSQPQNYQQYPQQQQQYAQQYQQPYGGPYGGTTAGYSPYPGYTYDPFTQQYTQTSVPQQQQQQAYYDYYQQQQQQQQQLQSSSSYSQIPNAYQQQTQPSQSQQLQSSSSYSSVDPNNYGFTVSPYPTVPAAYQQPITKVPSATKLDYSTTTATIPSYQQPSTVTSNPLSNSASYSRIPLSTNTSSSYFDYANISPSKKTQAPLVSPSSLPTAVIPPPSAATFALGTSSINLGPALSQIATNPPSSSSSTSSTSVSPSPSTSLTQLTATEDPWADPTSYQQLIEQYSRMQMYDPYNYGYANYNTAGGYGATNNYAGYGGYTDPSYNPYAGYYGTPSVPEVSSPSSIAPATTPTPTPSNQLKASAEKTTGSHWRPAAQQISVQQQVAQAFQPAPQAIHHLPQQPPKQTQTKHQPQQPQQQQQQQQRPPQQLPQQSQLPPKQLQEIQKSEVETSRFRAALLEKAKWILSEVQAVFDILFNSLGASSGGASIDVRIKALHQHAEAMVALVQQRLQDTKESEASDIELPLHLILRASKNIQSSLVTFDQNRQDSGSYANVVFSIQNFLNTLEQLRVTAPGLNSITRPVVQPHPVPTSKLSNVPPTSVPTYGPGRAPRTTIFTRPGSIIVPSTSKQPAEAVPPATPTRKPSEVSLPTVTSTPQPPIPEEEDEISGPIPIPLPTKPTPPPPKPKRVYASKEEAASTIQKWWRYQSSIHRRFHDIVQKYVKSEESLNLRQRNHALREIYTSEKTYLHSLKVMIDIYIGAMRESAKSSKPVIKQSEIDAMFPNLEMIYNVNNELTSELKTRLDQWPTVQIFGDIFLKMAPTLKLYTGYINNYDLAAQTLVKLRETNEQFNIMMFECMGKATEPIQPLESYMIMPIQRLPRYELLLRELLKKTEKEHSDYKNLQEAVTKVKEIVCYVNEKKREYDNKRQLLSIQERIEGLPGDIIQPSRYYVKEGPFQAKNMSSSYIKRLYFIFLLNDMILFTSPRNLKNLFFNQSFQFECSMMYTNLEIKDVPETTEFEIINKITRERWRFFSADEDHKQAWFASLKQLIDARQLEMMCSKALHTVANAPETLFREPESGAELLGIKVTSFKKIWDDRRTGAKFPLGLWRPSPPKGFYIVGDFAERSQEENPTSFVMAVAERSKPGENSSPSSIPLLAIPSDFVQVWNSNHSGGTYGECTIWKPIAPPGYVALGYVATDSSEKPVLRSKDKEDGLPFACVHLAALRRSGFSDSKEGYLWHYKGGFFSFSTNCTLYGVKNGPPGVFIATNETPKTTTQLQALGYDGYSFAVAHSNNGRKSTVLDTKPTIPSSASASSSSASSSSDLVRRNGSEPVGADDEELDDFDIVRK